MQEIYLTGTAFQKRLDIKPDLFKKLCKEGAPKSAAGKGYPLKEFLAWIMNRPQTRKEAGIIKDKAAKLLAEINSGNKKPEPKKTTKAAAVNQSDETGLLPALERARSAELAAYQNHIKIYNDTGFISSAALDAWQKTLDILRKCEKDFTDVLKQRRELIEIKRVQEWLEQRNDQAKQMLLNLPAKVAPALEGLPWHEIQKILTQEVREVVCKLGNIE